MFTFSDVKPMERDLAEAAFESGNEKEICCALVSVAFYDPEWQWVQEKCLAFLQNENPDISGLAATCLGHVARIHGNLDKDRVINALRKKLSVQEISGRVEDVLDDIEMFLSE